MYASYNSNVYCSRIDDFQNFSFSAPRTAAEGEIVNYPGGGDITGLADRGKYVAVFKKDYIGSLEFKDYDTTLSDIATPDTIVSGINIGAVNNKGIVQKDFSFRHIQDNCHLRKYQKL